MSYSVKEIYCTLQGEGAQTGRAAVFLRFSGCNLWSGREKDRRSAICQFCDTDFVGTDGPGGGKFKDPRTLAGAVGSCWVGRSRSQDHRLVVCTGGEPLLQLDAALIEELHNLRFQVAVETHGTPPVPIGVDWVCVSPKAGADLLVKKGDELKLVFPQDGMEPELFEHLEFAHFFLQPMDGPALEENTLRAIEHCLKYPRWRLSIQTHKLIGLD
jgi:7-carboxy-7-deazaguanine synthase